MRLLRCQDKDDNDDDKKIIGVQMGSHFDGTPSDLLSGFKHGYSMQNEGIILYYGNLEKCLDTKDIAGAVLMGLSIAYDCIPHDQLS